MAGSYVGRFRVLPGTPWSLLIGQPELRKLPCRFIFNGSVLFEGTNSFQPVTCAPSHEVGTGIVFEAGTDAEKAAVTDILKKVSGQRFRVVRTVWSF